MINRIIRQSDVKSHAGGLPLLNKHNGCTTLCYAESASSVRVYTRDVMKTEWLSRSWGIDIAEQIDVIGDYEDFPVYVLRMERLHRKTPGKHAWLRTATKLVSRSVLDYNRVFNPYLGREVNNPHKYYDTLTHVCNLIDTTHAHLEYHKPWFVMLKDFVANYDVTQISLDLSPRQFMENSAGELVLIDPVYYNDLDSFWR